MRYEEGSTGKYGHPTLAIENNTQRVKEGACRVHLVGVHKLAH